MFPTTYVRESTLRPNSRTLEHDRQQRYRSAVCLIAHQYSYATFVWLRFHFLQEKFGALCKGVRSYLRTPLSCVSMKLRNLELRKFGSVCTKVHFLGVFLIFSVNIPEAVVAVVVDISSCFLLLDSFP
jgi:hypothetical protein